ncbi:MAG TPA: hypothetical protein VN963_09420 [bacterium]|nr:hypothetical protein [bacterium]
MKKILVVLLISSSIGIISWSFTGCSAKLGSEPYYGYVTATSTPVSTPSPGITPSPGTTPVPGSIFNSSSAVTPWTINAGSSTEGNTGATGVGFNSGFSGCASTTGAMEVTVGFTAQNQAIYIQDQLPSPVSLSGQSVTVILEVNGGWNSDSEFLGGEIFVQQGATAGAGTAYASLYSSGVGFYNASTSSSTSSGCVTLTVTLPSSATNANTSAYNIYGGPFDPAQVGYWGLQIYTGGGGSGFASTTFDIQSWLY